MIQIPDDLKTTLNDQNLLQPINQNNDDTIGRNETGTGAASYSGVFKTVTKSSASTKATSK